MTGVCESGERQMKIDRERVKKAFAEYTRQYDSEDEKIKLKIVHTYKVAELCERIAVSLGLSGEDIDLAWLIGMLHDVGRFEQVRRYNTFEDAKSVDHAQMGIHVLWEEKRIRDYIGDSAEDDLIRLAITQHNVYRIPEDLTAREAMFCNIIRDADKVDIFRVNTEVALEDIYNVSTEELYNAVVTDRVMEDFYQHHAVLRAHKASPVDHVVGHISLVFELVYPISLRIALEQGYVDRLMHFASHNPTTRQQFGEIRQEMERYLKEGKIC